MFEAIPVLLAFVFVSLIFTTVMAEPEDRHFLLAIVVISWCVLAPLVSAVNAWMPFAGGGDDEDYFIIATRFIGSWHDLMDPLHFQGLMEQPGFPWILGAINLFFFPGLLGLKFLNLLNLQFLVLIWYRIGFELGSQRFARRIALGIIFLTPLWFYVFFLFKDLSIVLLQSVFLLGLIQLWKGRAGWGWVLIVVSSIAILPFRSPLFIQNMAVAVATILLSAAGPGKKSHRLSIGVIGLPLIAFLLMLASSPAIMAAIGVDAGHRVIGSEAMWEQGKISSEASSMSRVLFPLLYLFSEVTGLSSASWEALDSSWMRGVLALPWIAFVVPLFLLGIYRLSVPVSASMSSKGILNRVFDSRITTTPWAVLIVFIVSSLAVSWSVGETTRWRLSDMPPIMAIAIGAWSFGSQRQAINLIIFWLLFAGISFTGFYLMRLL